MDAALLILLIFSVLFFLTRWSSSVTMSEDDGLVLFDFTTLPHLDAWTEESDTKREVGKSKAVFDLQKTKLFQRAIFFTLLNPQENGAGFAGVRTGVKFDLSKYDKIVIYGRAQGSSKGYKIVLRHNGQDNEPFPTYEQIFQAPPSEEFHLHELPLAEFKAYYRGRHQPDAPPLNKANITRLGLQVYGGVYMDHKQKGVSSFEVDYIKAH